MPMPNFPHIPPFRPFIPPMSLPAVYGDELSYMELLAKVEKWLSDLVESNNLQNAAIVALYAAWEEFKNGGYTEGFEEFLDQWFADNQDHIDELLTGQFADELAAIQETADGAVQTANEAEQAVAGKVNMPSGGTNGQVLSKAATDTGTAWVDPIVPTDEQTETYITKWLNEHPEATTTVQDLSITTPKLANGAVTNTKTSDTVLAYRTLASGTDLNTITGSGFYAVPLYFVNSILNRPDNTDDAAAILVVYKGAFSGAAATAQYYMTHTASGHVSCYTRAINNESQTPITGYGWKPIFGVIHQSSGTNEYELMSQKGITDLFNLTLTPRGQLQSNTDLNNIVDTGIYRIPGYIISTIINKPADIPNYQTTLIVLRGTYSGAVVTTQIYMAASSSGDVITYHRAINNETFEVITGYDWQQFTGTIAQSTGNSVYRTMSQKAITDAIGTSVSPRPWHGKTLIAFGDSRTWYAGKNYTETCKEEWRGRLCVGYQQTVQELTGATNIINAGGNGNTTKEIADRMAVYDFTGIDAAIIAGGVNDFVRASVVTIGAIAPIGSEFDRSTAYGSLQYAIEYMLTNYPSTKIYMCVPNIAWVGGNIFPYSIAEVRKNIAELYNIPYVDLYKTTGINVINRSYLCCDDPTLTNQWYLHFNDYGNIWIGRQIAGLLNSH